MSLFSLLRKLIDHEAPVRRLDDSVIRKCCQAHPA
jgi:hypothetical protein